MTIAEQLEAKGEKRGYQLGRLLANGADRSLIKIATGLSDIELDKI